MRPWPLMRTPGAIFIALGVFLTGCGSPTESDASSSPSLFGRSTLFIDVKTEGAQPDPNGYLLTAQRIGGSLVVVQMIEPNVFLKEENLIQGEYIVQLDNLSENCSFDGDKGAVGSVNIFLPRGDQAVVLFRVNCP